MHFYLPDRDWPLVDQRRAGGLPLPGSHPKELGDDPVWRGTGDPDLREGE
jgi:hypothetical protein